MNRRRRNKVNQVDAREVVRRENSEVLIDGYNLMHVTRFKPMGKDEGELRRCRDGMLALLAEQLPANRYRNITIVFDSGDAPMQLADEIRWQHLNVVFARNENSADDLIAIRITENATPKHLVVVSSDHRVQIAARRKKATTLDSDKWFDALLDFRPTVVEAPPSGLTAKTEQLSQEELEAFRNEMNVPFEDDPGSSSESSKGDEFENPFPEGYFDDLEDEM